MFLTVYWCVHASDAFNISNMHNFLWRSQCSEKILVALVQCSPRTSNECRHTNDALANKNQFLVLGSGVAYLLLSLTTGKYLRNTCTERSCNVLLTHVQRTYNVFGACDVKTYAGRVLAIGCAFVSFMAMRMR